VARASFEAIRIYYFESTTKLRVVRILHGRRDVRWILNQEKNS
jgi:plasmid stabilization system protein ParE